MSLKEVEEAASRGRKKERERERKRERRERERVRESESQRERKRERGFSNISDHPVLTQTLSLSLMICVDGSTRWQCVAAHEPGGRGVGVVLEACAFDVL
jgi:hypothetical protein